MKCPFRAALGLAVIFGLLSPGAARAIPVLQVDILGGTYDPTTETTISTSSTFTLRALLLGDTLDPADPYYISAALMPSQTQTSPDFGTLSFDGQTYDISDAAYGVPPFEGTLSTFDAGDLSKHSVFPTYFYEFGFTFGGASTITPAYNTADGSTNTNQFLYYVDFVVDTSALLAGYAFHFDLYNTRLLTTGDIDVDLFAPFSHDAQSCTAGDNCEQVPEPATLLLVAVPALGLIGVRARRRHSPIA